MKTFRFFVFAAIALAAVGCSKSDLFLEEEQIIGGTKKPIGFEIIDNGVVDVVFDDNSRENAEHFLSMSAEDTIKVAGTNAIQAVEELYTELTSAQQVVEFSYNYEITNTLKIEGMTMNYSYAGKSYKLPCLSKVFVGGEHNSVEESNDPAYYELSKTNYVLAVVDGAELDTATQVFVVEEGYVPPTFDRTEWGHEHVSFRRLAEIVNDVITVVCDNVANFVDIYSDGSRQNEESVDYAVENKFAFNAPVIKVDELSEVVGCTFNFENGVVTVADQTVSAVWRSAKVVGKVMHNGRDYASEIVACEAEAKTITFTSATEATVRFYKNNSSDFADVFVNVLVKEKRKLVGTDESYNHIACQRNANVAGNNIAVVCDNAAKFVDKYSNNTTEEENVDYNVTNNFSFNIPAIVVSNASSILGQTFFFNAGTADIEGVNAVVNFVNRQVSAIMHNGRDYRGNAPECEVAPKTITVTSTTEAIIRFENVHDASDYSKAGVIVNVVEAEKVVGEIVGMWITDAYQGRTLTSTDLHILARNNNGSFVVYSRGVNETSFTTTQLTASEGQSILSSGLPVAWVYTTGGSRMLSVVDYIQSSKENTGYVIDYLNFNGQVLIALGDAEAALNGVPFAEPLKATGSAENGTWTISYNGDVNYFVGTIHM